MIRGLYTAVSGMISLEAKQSAVTNNMANINTNGYRTEEVNLKSFDEVMIQNKDNNLGKKEKIGSLSLGVEIDGTSLREEQGVLKITDRTTDFAIDGEGYFVVNRNGENFYTRDGKFRVTTSGYLVNSSGDSVIGKNIATGALEPIFVGNDDFIMNKNNEISVKGNLPVYEIATAKFDEKLPKYGDNLYKGTNPSFESVVYVAQGNLEQSNVSIVNEMTNMISVMRAFETNQKIVQTMDDILGKAANEIGTVR
ncbi:MAG: flagellar hook-basal body complex protein [Sarcina sp.]